MTAIAGGDSDRWSVARPGDLTRATVGGSDAYVGTEGGFVAGLGS